MNDIDNAYESIKRSEDTIEVTQDNIYKGMSLEEFGDAVRDQMSRVKAYKNKFNYDGRASRNRKYYLGDQVDTSSLRDDQEKGVDNVIFRDMETLIPIANSRVPELSITPTFKNQQTREYATSTKKGLQTEWEVLQKMKKKIGIAIRNHQIHYVAALKCGYDMETNKNWTEHVSGDDILVSKDGSFVAEYIRDETLGDILDRFPEKEKEILTALGYGIKPVKEILDSPVTYIEAWTNEYVGWILDTIPLGMEKNPYFDYDGDDVNGQKVKFNQFDAPRHPYIFLNYYNLGRHIMDDTTLIEQSIGAQDWINKRKRQIGANADSTNGHWVTSGDFISKEEFAKLEGAIDEKIWLQKGLPKDGFVKITGQPLPDYIYNDLQDSRMAVDNIFGTHSTTRGEESGNRNLGQDILMKDQDFGRMDGYVRDGIEAFAQDWFEYQYHLYLVFATEDKSIPIPEDDDFESDNVIFSRSRVPLIQKNDGTIIPVPVILKVQQGSTLPQDDVAEYQRAVQMKDILSPLDFFRKMGEPNPRELTKNLLIWMHNPMQLFKDDPDVQELLQAMQSKGDEPPKVSVSVKGESPQGTQILEQKGLLPQGFTQYAMQNQQKEMAAKASPKPGELRSQPKKAADMPPEKQQNGQQDMNGMGAKEGLVNAMTQMLRSGEAQQILNA